MKINVSGIALIGALLFAGYQGYAALQAAPQFDGASLPAANVRTLNLDTAVEDNVKATSVEVVKLQTLPNATPTHYPAYACEDIYTAELATNLAMKGLKDDAAKLHGCTFLPAGTPVVVLDRIGDFGTYQLVWIDRDNSKNISWVVVGGRLFG
jgi:hypothetical protein